LFARTVTEIIGIWLLHTTYRLKFIQINLQKEQKLHEKSSPIKRNSLKLKYNEWLRKVQREG
jgi:hypothetical protein